MLFEDRQDAANKLFTLLKNFMNVNGNDIEHATIIAAIPRGALEIGSILSKKLNLPLDIVVTKKIPAPGNPEYAIGAIAPDGEVLINKVLSCGIDEEYIESVKRELTNQMEKRYRSYKGGAARVQEHSNIPDFCSKKVILVDDGVATGFTVKAAIAYLRRCKAKEIIVAVPVAAPNTAAELEELADQFICLHKPAHFAAVGQFYRNFPQVSDEEAIKLLKDANAL
jgi:putative phosphoribosyl transferase